jgi:hypothetical protein
MNEAILIDDAEAGLHPTWLNLVFKSTADFGEDVAEVVG